MNTVSSYPIPIPYRLKNNTIVKDFFTFKFVKQDDRFVYYANALEKYRDYRWVMYNDYSFYKDVYKYSEMIYNKDNNIIVKNIDELTIKWNDSYDIEEELVEVTIYNKEQITITDIIDTIVDFYEDTLIYPNCNKCALKMLYYNPDENEITVHFDIK